MKLHDLFHAPSVELLRARMLDEARHHLLTHTSLQEYHTAMSDMLRGRISRLSAEQAADLARRDQE